MCSWYSARAPKTLFASVYTATSGPNTYSLCNKMYRVWSVSVKALKRVKAASHTGLKGILALKRALERLWRHQECACTQLYSLRLPNNGFLKLWNRWGWISLCKGLKNSNSIVFTQNHRNSACGNGFVIFRNYYLNLFRRVFIPLPPCLIWPPFPPLWPFELLFLRIYTPFTH